MNDRVNEEVNASELISELDIKMREAFKERESNPLNSFAIVKSVYEQSKSNKLISMELKALHGLCSMSHYYTPEDDQTNWIDVFLNRGNELKNNLAIGRAYIHYYRDARQKEKFVEASKFLNTALKYLDPKKYPVDVSSCYTGLGNLYAHLEDFDKALEFYHRALELKKDQPIIKSFNLLQNIAGVYLSKKDYAKAWESYHDLLPVVPEWEVTARARILQNLGHICNETEQREDAVTYFMEALEIKLKSGSEHQIIHSFCNVINSQIILDNPEDAYISIKQAEKHLKPENLADQIDFLETYLNYCELTDDKNMQIDLYRKLLAVKNKQTKLTALDQVNKYEVQHQLDLYQNTISLLKNKNVMLSEKVKNLADNLQESIKQNGAGNLNQNSGTIELDEEIDLLETHHQLSSISELLSMIDPQWKHPLNLINKLVYEIKDAYYLNELSWDSLTTKTEHIEKLVSFLSDNIKNSNELLKERKIKVFWASSAIKAAVKILKWHIEDSKIEMSSHLIDDFIIHGDLNIIIQINIVLILKNIEMLKDNNQTNHKMNITLDSSKKANSILFSSNCENIPKDFEKTLFLPIAGNFNYGSDRIMLTNCKHIIENLFDGSITFETTTTGTLFIVNLPAKSSSSK